MPADHRFWIRACTHATPSGMKRFLDEFARFLSAVVEQSRDRDQGHLRTSEEYFALRRYTVGTEACYPFALLNVDLPLEVSEQPIFEDLRRCVTEIVILDNVSCLFVSMTSLALTANAPATGPVLLPQGARRWGRHAQCHPPCDARETARLRRGNRLAHGRTRPAGWRVLRVVGQGIATQVWIRRCGRGGFGLSGSSGELAPRQ